jgi:hypothetical protein
LPEVDLSTPVQGMGLIIILVIIDVAPSTIFIDHPGGEVFLILIAISGVEGGIKAGLADGLQVCLEFNVYREPPDEENDVVAIGRQCFVIV